MEKNREEEFLLLVAKLSLKRLKNKGLSEEEMKELASTLAYLDLSLEEALDKAEKILLRR